MPSIKEETQRVNTRILKVQHEFIKGEAKKAKGRLSEGDIHRELLSLGIKVYKESKKSK